MTVRPQKSTARKQPLYSLAMATQHAEELMAMSAVDRRLLAQPKNCGDGLDLSRQEPAHARIRWSTWLLILAAGVACGAAVDLFALWLFLYWTSR